MTSHNMIQILLFMLSSIRKVFPFSISLSYTLCVCTQKEWLILISEHQFQVVRLCKYLYNPLSYFLAWAWIGGSKIGNQHSTVDGKGSCPGARSGTTSWFHSDSTVWVFGGKGFGLKKSRSSRQLHEHIFHQSFDQLMTCIALLPLRGLYRKMLLSGRKYHK